MAAFTVKLTDEPSLVLPRSIGEELGLVDGAEVKITIEHNTIRLELLDKFLKAMGARADDPLYAEATAESAKAWERWSKALDKAVLE